MEKRLKKLEVILAVFLLFIPLMLIVVNGEVRNSISDYAYSKNNLVFGSLLAISSALFVYNGTMNREKWYNIVLGVSLLGTAVTPHLDYPVWHYSFAALFFLGSVTTMIVFSSAAQRELKIVLGTLIVLALLGYYITEMYSLLIAEWIGILPISIHFIGESLNKID